MYYSLLEMNYYISLETPSTMLVSLYYRRIILKMIIKLFVILYLLRINDVAFNYVVEKLNPGVER